MKEEKIKVISRVTFKGEVPIRQFYKIVERINKMKQMGYVSKQHIRKDAEGFIKFDFELELHDL